MSDIPDILTCCVVMPSQILVWTITLSWLSVNSWFNINQLFSDPHYISNYITSAALKCLTTLEG